MHKWVGVRSEAEGDPMHALLVVCQATLKLKADVLVESDPLLAFECLKEAFRLEPFNVVLCRKLGTLVSPLDRRCACYVICGEPGIRGGLRRLCPTRFGRRSGKTAGLCTVEGATHGGDISLPARKDKKAFLSSYRSAWKCRSMKLLSNMPRQFSPAFLDTKEPRNS